MTPIDWTKPPAEILAELLAIVERRLPLSEAWATGARGLRDFGAGGAGWGGMLAKLKQIGYSDVADQMVSGLDFGDPQVQLMLTQLGTIEPDTFTFERVEILRSWGVERKPRWMFTGFAEPPTIAEVEFRKGRELAIASTAERLNAASEARREAIDDATKTGEEIENATVEAFD
jgi:hypothetical protein